MDLTLSIVSEVAERESRRPTELPPLYTAVDPDTLRAFADSPLGGAVSVEFQYCGYTVEVSGDNEVDVCVVEPARTHTV